MKILPPPPALIQRCQALAALDLILSPEWEDRFYSFNRAWSPREQMASMRNGCGDEWWIVFHADGWAALKGLDHESPVTSEGSLELSKLLQATFPPELQGFATEPAFNWPETGFAGFYTPQSAAWTRANDLTPFAALEAGDDALLHLLVSPPLAYVQFAAGYYEKDISEAAVAAIFSLRPIIPAVVSSLNPAVSLEEIRRELFDEIGYPH